MAETSDPKPPANSTEKLPGAVVALRAAVASYLGDDDADTVVRAYQLGAKAHAGQKRKTGEDYIFHPVAVAHMLADMGMDRETICAAILHDTIEDTDVTKQQLSDQFGQTVADLVDGVTKLDKVSFDCAEEAAAESFRKMLLAMARDIRVILIKLADRLHNMQSVNIMRPEKRRRIARETLDIYAPIAARLGMDHFKRELQELAFANRYPMRYRIIRDSVDAALGRNQERLQRFEKELTRRLKAEGIECQIEGRAKTPFSIYNKMKTKLESFREVLDVLGFRVVVDTVSECYQALGVVHAMARPRIDRFKDYIAIPKANGYQSLHTVLVEPNGEPTEIQIRTAEMDAVAESGIAAHWAYKVRKDSTDASARRARDWLFRVLDMQTSADGSVDFLEHVKVDLFPDEVYVFTPKGDIREMPRNASVLDFAYSIHTDVGNQAVHAWVGNKLVPLRHRLQSGETIKIITTPAAKPRSSWLEFVVTSKARSAIRHHLKQLASDEAVQMGHLLLDRALSRLGTSLDEISDGTVQSYLASAQMERLEQLLSDIAMGNRMPSMVAGQINDLAGRKGAEGQLETLLITGEEGHVVSYPNCCQPVPGDKITGYLSAGKGLVVHRVSCRNLKEFRKFRDRFIDVDWAAQGLGEFKVDLKIDVMNRPGVLASVASIISATDTNIDNVEQSERDGNTSLLTFTIDVTDRKHLARVIRRVRRGADVIAVTRATG